MRKTDKKLDNHLRLALTDVCEQVLEDIPGFTWLTHKINFANFPQSLQVYCIFTTDQALQDFQKSEQSDHINKLIQSSLQGIGIRLSKINSHIYYDTEEKCDLEHGGNWAKRLS